MNVIFNGQLSGLDVIVEEVNNGNYLIKTSLKEDYKGGISRIGSSVAIFPPVSKGEKIEWQCNGQEELKELLIRIGHSESMVDDFLRKLFEKA